MDLKKILAFIFSDYGLFGIGFDKLREFTIVSLVHVVKLLEYCVAWVGVCRDSNSKGVERVQGRLLSATYTSSK